MLPKLGSLNTEPGGATISSSIPLVRASALVPVELWLKANGHPSEAMFRAAGLPASPVLKPMRLVAFRNFVDLMSDLSSRFGPDFGCVAATAEGLMGLGVPAQAVRASRTLGEAMEKVSGAFHQHVSHVFFRVSPSADGMVVSTSMPVNASNEANHYALQHTAMLVLQAGVVLNGERLPARIKIPPHPVHGISHLLPHFGPDVVAVSGRSLSVEIPAALLDVAFPWEPDGKALTDVPQISSAARTSLSASARVLIEGMLDDEGEPGIDRLAQSAGRSRRTLQRLLAAEGTSFARLLDSVREQRAMAHLADSRTSVSAVAGEVGYRNASSLTRAVRRWTDDSPRSFRRQLR